jgi:hypothetical protein
MARTDLRGEGKDDHLVSTLGMFESETPRVKGHPLETVALAKFPIQRAFSVVGIAEYRMGEMLEMTPHLVKAIGAGANGEPGDVPRECLENSQPAELAHRVHPRPAFPPVYG